MPTTTNTPQASRPWAKERPIAPMKAPTAKPKLLSRPKPKTTVNPTPKPIETPLLGPPVVVAMPAPTLEPTELVEPVIQSKPLIITIPPEIPTPAAENAILTSADDKKPSGVVELPLATEKPPVTDATVPTGYIVVESDATDLPQAVEPPPAPAVPTVTIPAGQAMEDISSIQIGDVLIIAVKVQAKQEPEATG